MVYSLEVCEAFLTALRRLQAGTSGRPVVIGVDGRAGSGKTISSHLLADTLGKLGGRVLRLRFDAFWVGGQEFVDLVAALPELALSATAPGDYVYAWLLCRERLLARLRSGTTADRELRRLVAACCADDAAAQPGAADPEGADWVILEGTTCLRRELRASYDLSLLLRLDPQVCVRQWLARERGQGADYFLNVWVPLESRYFEEHQPEAAADFVIDPLPARSAFLLSAGV